MFSIRDVAVLDQSMASTELFSRKFLATTLLAGHLIIRTMQTRPPGKDPDIRVLPPTAVARPVLDGHLLLSTVGLEHQFRQAAQVEMLVQKP